MKYTTHTFKTRDRENIFYYKWDSIVSDAIKGIIQVSHGIDNLASKIGIAFMKVNRQIGKEFALFDPKVFNSFQNS